MLLGCTGGSFVWDTSIDKLPFAFNGKFVCNTTSWRGYMTVTTGIDLPWDYSIIPDIPQLSPELTQTLPVYTQTSPDSNPWMPGLFPDIHWGIPSLPWLPPEIFWETHVSPEDTLTFPDGHPWWPELPPYIPWRLPDGPIYQMTSPVGMEISFLKKIQKKLKFCL